MEKKLQNKSSSVLSIRKLVLFLIVSCGWIMSGWAQSVAPKVSLNEKDANFAKVVEQLKRQTGYEFVFNSSDVSSLNAITISVQNESLTEVLDQIFAGKGLTYTISGKTVVMKKSVDVKAPISNGKKITVKGRIIDKTSGQPVVGATIVVVGTTVGAISDEKGQFSLVAYPTDKLDISFVGLKPIIYDKELPVNRELQIVMEQDAMAVDDVVVTGFFTKNKNSFTGSVKTMTVEDLKAVSNVNLIGAISMLTPGLRMVENNKFGSNPNRVPEIVIRGTSSLATDSDESANQPVIILDGVEITMRDLYDIDMNDIERVDVLKDASATALYGEKAANGVIVIERKPVLNDKLRLSYNLDTSFDVPDLNTYNYLNATEKLDFERLAGLYDFNIADEFEDYNRKFKRVAGGLDTDWLAKPLRSGYTINNSVGVSGRGNNVTYRVNANLKNQRGVMKDDYRNNIGLSTFLSYHIADKVTVSYQNKFANTKSKNSPYGSFTDYIRMNPYDSPYDEFGNLVYFLSWDAANPLYEATVGNFDKTNSMKFSNTLKIRWQAYKDMYITAQGDITTARESGDLYKSPKSTEFAKIDALDKKGVLTKSEKRSDDVSGNLVINYSKSLDSNGTMISAHLGGDIYQDRIVDYKHSTMGYSKENLFSPNFAAGYGDLGALSPSGNELLSARLGLFASANFILRNRYFVDGSFRRSGSSKFGTENKYAPFWSVGAGWNIHNEKFLSDKEWINTARLRYSYGVTGSVDFSPYQAITTYAYSFDYYYLHGIGAVPKAMGNKDLTWQSTATQNIGLNVDLFAGRLSFVLDYYVKTTNDMLIDLSVPLSVGQETVKANLGSMRNYGFEFDVSSVLYKSKYWRLNLKFNGAWNNNKILAISNALDFYNKENNKENTVAPKLQYKENQSTTAIYAVRSAGINPATGKEVFINRFGQYTLTYDAEDKIVVGDLTPLVEGAIFPSISYKNITLSFALGYRFGGQIYNETRAENVENVNPKHNVDKRAYEQRWKKVNDVPPYLDISNSENRAFRHTARFVEDDNTLEFKRIELSYEFNPDFLSRIGFKRLRLSAAANDPFRISTVRYERGTIYPFSRGFSFSISPTF